jgi:membrane-associated phospholipid phosphatase
MSVTRAVLLGLGLLFAAGRVQAQPLEWDPRWPRFRPGEAAATLALGTVTLLAEQAQPQFESPRWSGGILLDDALRDLLRARSAEGNLRAVENSDRLFRLALVSPLVLDVWVLALGVHRSPDVALQLLLMNVEALAFTGSVVLATQLLTRRARPYVQDCGEAGGVNFTDCGTKRDYTSFVSGHTAVAMTSAMLMCAQHQHLALLGGGAADAAVCLTMVGIAVGTGLLRVVADRHYASDVIGGLAVGVVSGYVLPSWLHFGFGRTPPRASGPRFTWRVSPHAERGALGLRMSGLLP